MEQDQKHSENPFIEGLHKLSGEVLVVEDLVEEPKQFHNEFVVLEPKLWVPDDCGQEKFVRNEFQPGY